MVHYIVISLVPDFQNEGYVMFSHPARTIATFPEKMNTLMIELDQKFKAMHKKFVQKNVGWIIPDYILNSFKSILEIEGNKEIQKWIDDGLAASVDHDPLVGETTVEFKAFLNVVNNYGLSNDGMHIHRQAAANMAGSIHSTFTVH